MPASGLPLRPVDTDTLCHTFSRVVGFARRRRRRRRLSIRRGARSMSEPCVKLARSKIRLIKLMENSRRFINTTLFGVIFFRALFILSFCFRSYTAYTRTPCTGNENRGNFSRLGVDVN